MHNKKNIEREFNITGLCLPEKHFMADRSDRIKEVVRLAEKGKYFTINRPRQYGKTTVLFQVEKELAKMDYLVISLNFQEVGESMFSSEK
ncbi:MAG: AAA family ATPase, partial [bacterium]|nr:AAA family ATPase [bacterium]